LVVAKEERGGGSAKGGCGGGALGWGSSGPKKVRDVCIESQNVIVSKER